MENINNILTIYEELENCSSNQEVLSVRNKSKSACNRVSDVSDKVKTIKGNRGVGDLCRDIDSLIKEGKELVAQGDFPYGITIEAPEDLMVKLPVSELVGQEFCHNVDDICAHLMNNEVTSIGVYGMGGVGKTTLVKHVHNMVLDNPNIFRSVYWVTVSKDCTIRQLQNKIAKQVLNEDISQEDDPCRREVILQEGLKRKNKFVLFLDDVWKYFDLNNVGNPTESGGKLVLTTRNHNVCGEIGCHEIIKVNSLPENEAWELFDKYIKSDIPRKIEEIAKLVVRECAGLPLGIITLARSMRACKDIHEWRNVLNDLRKSRPGLSSMEEDVFQVLRVSYDRLNNKKLQECLLCCAAYPEDYDIPREELIWVLIGRGLLVNMKSMHEMIDEGHHILNDLERACLVSGFVKIYEGKMVKLHDLIRDMALRIAGPRFMVKTGIELTDFPNNKDWTKELEVVSLMLNGSLEIPPLISPECSRLSFLLLRETKLSVTHSFFEKMYGLQVLNLFGSDIEVLPNSISYLEKLTALLLGRCGKLKNIPSLENLTDLIMLDLSCTSIRELPEGLENLTNLRYLNLKATFSLKLKMFPDVVLDKLFNLEYLLVNRINSYPNSDTGGKVSGQKLLRLRKLEKFEGYLLDIHDFNEFVRHVDMYGQPNDYVLMLGHKHTLYNPEFRFDRVVLLANCDISGVELPKCMQSLYVSLCEGITTLSDVPSLVDATCLEYCEIYKGFMNSLFSSPVSPATFSQLKELDIRACEYMNKLFSMELLMKLENLKKVSVAGCWCLEGIIYVSNDEDAKRKEVIANSTFFLPNFEYLSLDYLHQLRSIFYYESEWADYVLFSSFSAKIFSNLRSLKVRGCSNIRQLFTMASFKHLRNLETIRVESCAELKEIIGPSLFDNEDANEEGFATDTLDLRTPCELSLFNLPKLKRICGTGVILSRNAIKIVRIDWWPQLEDGLMYS